MYVTFVGFKNFIVYIHVEYNVLVMKDRKSNCITYDHLYPERQIVTMGTCSK